MTHQEKLEVQFYQGEAAQALLKRFTFSDEELSVINAAILTSRKDIPNMKFIHTADALLKQISATREPNKEAQTPQSAEALAKIEMMSIKQNKRAFKTEANESRNRSFTLLDSKLQVVVALALLISFALYKNIYTKEDLSSKLYTFKEAQAYCKEQNLLLPLTLDDAPDLLIQPSHKNSIGYWSEKQKILFNITKGWGGEKDDGKKHYVTCVKKNGKQNRVKR